MLPPILTEKDNKVLDNATALEALRVVYSLLTNEQKNTVISNDDGARVTVFELVTCAIENAS